MTLVGKTIISLTFDDSAESPSHSSLHVMEGLGKGRVRQGREGQCKVIGKSKLEQGMVE